MIAVKLCFLSPLGGVSNIMLPKFSSLLQESVSLFSRVKLFRSTVSWAVQCCLADLGICFIAEPCNTGWLNTWFIWVEALHCTCWWTRRKLSGNDVNWGSDTSKEGLLLDPRHRLFRGPCKCTRPSQRCNWCVAEQTLPRPFLSVLK